MIHNLEKISCVKTHLEVEKKARELNLRLVLNQERNTYELFKEGGVIFESDDVLIVGYILVGMEIGKKHRWY